MPLPWKGGILELWHNVFHHSNRTTWRLSTGCERSELTCVFYLGFFFATTSVKHYIVL
jgi:hypothetical protein